MVRRSWIASYLDLTGPARSESRLSSNEDARHRISIPGSGTQPILLEDLSNNRSDNVTLVDVRLEKTFAVNERHRVSGMVDVYNVLNANPVTSFSQRTGSNFGTVLAALPPRTVKVGVRWQF